MTDQKQGKNDRSVLVADLFRRSMGEGPESELVAGLMEVLQIPVILIDPAGQIIRYNSRMADILGRTATELAGQTLCHLVLSPAKEILKNHIENKFKKIGRDWIITTMIDALGERAVVGLSLTPFFTEDGEPEFVICYGFDIGNIDLTATKMAWYEQVFTATDNRFSLMGKDFRILAANDAYLDYYNLSRQSVIGHKVDIILEDADRKQAHFLINKALQGEMVDVSGWQSLKKFGRRFIKAKLLPYRSEGEEVTGVVSLARDATLEKITEENLLHYKMAVEGSSDLIVAVDSEYQYLLANQAFLEYRGMDEKEVVGRHAAEVLGQKLFEENLKPWLDKGLAGETVEFEVQTEYPNLGLRDLLVHYYPMYEPDGRVVGVVGLIRDITEIKNSQRALAHHEKELAEQAENLEEMNTALRVLVEHQAGEKRILEENIVSGIKNHVTPFVERLKRDNLTDSQRIYVNTIESNLDAALSPMASRGKSPLLDLSPVELQVATLVREGHTSKEVAEMLSISFDTVSFHRKNVRAKLGLSGSKTNLVTYLRSLKI